MKTLAVRPNTNENKMSDFNRYFASFFEDISPTIRIIHYSPAVNVQETKNNYFMEIELPGFDKKNIEVNIDGINLTIVSKPEEKKSEENGNYILRERRNTSLNRSFQLPGNADPEAISAAFKNGILSLNIKKRAHSKKRVIHINAA